MNINRVLLTGTVASGPKVSMRDDGSVGLITFGISVVTRFRKRNLPSGYAERTDVLDCIAYGRLVEAMADTLMAGDMVAVEGTLRKSTWDSDSGHHERMEVFVYTLDHMAPPLPDLDYGDCIPGTDIPYPDPVRDIGFEKGEGYR